MTIKAKLIHIIWFPTLIQCNLALEIGKHTIRYLLHREKIVKTELLFPTYVVLVLRVFANVPNVSG